MRINSKHRVVYTIEEKHLVKVWSAGSHYEKRNAKVAVSKMIVCETSN